MYVRFQLPDETFEQYKAQGKPKNKEGAQLAMRERLIRFASVDADERCLCIANDERRELERVFQTSMETFPRLLNAIKALCHFKIGTVERFFTAGELARINEQATFHGWTPEKYLEMTSNEAMDYIMDKV